MGEGTGPGKESICHFTLCCKPIPSVSTHSPKAPNARPGTEDRELRPCRCLLGCFLLRQGAKAVQVGPGFLCRTPHHEVFLRKRSSIGLHSPVQPQLLCSSLPQRSKLKADALPQIPHFLFSLKLLLPLTAQSSCFETPPHACQTCCLGNFRGRHIPAGSFPSP